jgi:hypothetical protein
VTTLKRIVLVAILILALSLLVWSVRSVNAKILFSNNFDAGDLIDWSGTNVQLGWTDESGNPQPPPTVSSANPFSGTYSLYFPPLYHSQCVFENVTLFFSTVYMQCEIYFDKLPSESNVVTFMTASAQPNDWKNIINVAVYNGSGKVTWVLDNPPFYPDVLSHEIPVKADSGPEPRKYYCVQLGCVRTGSKIVANLWVNGQDVITNYNYNGSSADFGQFYFGSYDKNKPGEFDGISVYLDDPKISDSYISYASASTPIPTPMLGLGVTVVIVLAIAAILTARRKKQKSPKNSSRKSESKTKTEYRAQEIMPFADLRPRQDSCECFNKCILLQQ